MREPAAAIVKAATAQETGALGARLGAALQSHSDVCIVITLSGDLGAGKTTFVSGLLRAFGVTGTVRSPTYTLIEPYEFERQSIYHLDLYRLANAAEVEGLALRDLMQPGNVVIVEWPERAAGQLSTPDVAISFHYLETGRELVIQHATALGAELAEAISSSQDDNEVFVSR